jgi:hypothetical protein
MSDVLPPAETQKTVSEAAELTEKLFTLLLEEPRPTVFVALQMLLSLTALQMGVSFEQLMVSIAQNVPAFYKRWNEMLTPGAQVIDLSAFRKDRSEK